jgi:uncharacterized membrane protein
VEAGLAAGADSVGAALPAAGDMSARRIFKHLITPDWKVKRVFPPGSLAAIEAAIRESEKQHRGEIRFAVEAALDFRALLRGTTARERAIEVFSELRVWDTEENTGVLIYLLLADHDVEIVCDRGISARVTQQEWNSICARMEAAFREGNFERGVLSGIEEIGALLARHFPIRATDFDELSNAPVTQ